MPAFAAPRRRALRMRLLAWYAAHRRDLPWRRSPDPYAIWVSEIMLQQTRVNAVLEHYARFLRLFPNVQALAAASLDSVLAAWSGLGYYRRARMMHAAAQQLAAAGEFPRTAAAWRELPGIGRYTAAAIASIAFSEPAAVVDGNVERVLRRITGEHTLDGEPLWQAAQELLDPAQPGDFNQAVMELGALVCTPASPACAQCPLHRMCGTRGVHASAPRPRPHRRELAYTFAERTGAVRLVQRGRAESLMAGMWELPTAAVNGKPPLFTVRHSITNTLYAVSVYEGSTAEGKWIATSELPQLALTGLARKILRRLQRM